MSEHYRRSVTEVSRWCDTCRRITTWSVSAGRLGYCTEHKAQEETKAQRQRREKAAAEARNPKLF